MPDAACQLVLAVFQIGRRSTNFCMPSFVSLVLWSVVKVASDDDFITDDDDNDYDDDGDDSNDDDVDNDRSGD